MTPFKSRTGYRGAWIALLPCLLAPAQQAAAANAVFCVTNDTQLKAAIISSESTPTTIALVQGTYDLKNTLWHFSGNGFSGYPFIVPGSKLLGGYDDASCTTRTFARNYTKLIDTGPSASASGGNDGFVVRGDLTVEGVTFSINDGPLIGAGDTFTGRKVPSGSLILFTRNFFLHGNDTSFGTGIVWEQADDSDSVIRVVDNLIANNSGAAFEAAFSISVFDGAPTVEFINNTVMDNTDGLAGAELDNLNSGAAKFYVDNNIFFGNATADLLGDQALVLVDNVIGVYSGQTPASETGTQPGPPQLDVNFRPIEMPVSPVINTGKNNVQDGLPAIDLAGNPRLLGPAVDRGAYESSIEFSALQTVTTVNDNGDNNSPTSGSLRAAVKGINQAGGGKISFDIGSTCGPHVITLPVDLPTLSVAATIDGYTQTGRSLNTLDLGDDATICVILEAGGTATKGLAVAAGAGDGVSVNIRGLGFSGFSTAGIDLLGGSEHAVSGNHFGGSIGGHTMLADNFDIRLGASSHDSTVGGNDVSDRNIIGGATGSGIVLLEGSTANQILGNYIGVGWSKALLDFTDIGNGARGILLEGDNNTIANNLIGYNVESGILLNALGAFANTVTNNDIGMAANANANVGNGGAGVRFSGAALDAPSNNVLRLNNIKDNGAQGVLVDIGQRNKIRKNAIDQNGALGIDLGVIGVNDIDDDGAIQSVDLANHQVNFPVLTAASGGYQNGIVSGSLTTIPGTYTVDFYRSSSCDGGSGSAHGEGALWVGSATFDVPTPNIGHQSVKDFTSAINVPAQGALLSDGSKITATTTDSVGDTSEFSACFSYTATGIVFADSFEL